MKRRTTSRWLAIFALGTAMAVTPIVASAARPDTTVPAGGGGELVDGSTFPQETPASIDPQVNSELDSYQVIRLMYDGLTDIDVSGEEPKTVPHQAESYESNEDATVWTFHIKSGLTFADGEPILPSTYVRSWVRAGQLQGPYSYLLDFIQGGNELRTGAADTLEGAVADDDAMTLTVTLAAPFAEFDAVAGFQLFRPTPQGAVDAGDAYDQGVMIDSGAYTMDTARNDQEVVLVKNDSWGGDFAGNTWDQRPDTIRFVISQDVDTSYNALEAGEVMSATVPSGRSADAMSTWGNSLTTSQLAVYYFAFDFRDDVVGGPDNLLLRQAISQAIDRDAINEAVFDGVRLPATGITPPGIPGFKEGLCQYCSYDPEAAQAAFDEWTAAGFSQSEPIPIQFNEGGVHGDVVDIVVANLAEIGIEATPDPQPSEGYFAAGHLRNAGAEWQQLQLQQSRVRRPRRRGDGHDRPGTARRTVQSGRGAAPEHRRHGRADQLVRRRPGVGRVKGRGLHPRRTRVRALRADHRPVVRMLTNHN